MNNHVHVNPEEIMLLPAGKTQLMENDTPRGQDSFRSSRNPIR